MVFQNCEIKKKDQSKAWSGKLIYHHFLAFSSAGMIVAVKIAEMINSAMEFADRITARSALISPWYTFEKRKKIPPKTKMVLVAEPTEPATIKPALFFIALYTK